MTDLRLLASLGLGVALTGLAGCAIDSEGDDPREGGEVAGEGSVPGLSTEVEPSTGAQSDPSVPSSPRFDADFAAASAEYDVPAAILKAIAWAETRYEMVIGEEEFDGKAPAFGVMALSGARLERGARLAKVSIDDAKKDARANVRAAAALLSALAAEKKIDRRTLVAWEPVIAAFSDIDRDDARKELVVDGVYGAMRQGLGNIVVPDQSFFGLFGSDLAGGPTEIKAAGPDYGPSIWRASPNASSRGATKPAMVIIHTCEGSYSSCWSWLTNSAAGVSAHYVVKEDGKEISQLVRESSRAWHIAADYNCSLNGNVDCGRNGTSSNNFTIGIEHGGFASTKTFNPGMIEASAKLVCDITKDHGIARDRFHIVGHGKLQPHNRTDPGPNWPWASYIQRINELCGSGGGAAPPPPAAGAPLIIDSNNGNNDRSRGYIEVGSSWTSSANVAGYYGSGYWWASTAAVSDGATFSFHLAADATKTIDAQWSSASDRAPDAAFVATDSRGARVGSATVNQRTNGGRWNTLGTWRFTAGWNKIVLSRSAGAGNVVIADAIRVR